MKSYHVIAPLIALAAGYYWISQKGDTLTELEEKTRIVKERIQLLQSSSFAPGPAGMAAGGAATTEKADEFTLPDGSLNWQAIADLMAKSEGRQGLGTDMKTMMKLQRRFMLMTEEEIEDGLAKIQTLDLSDSAKNQMSQSLYQLLGEKNPEKALELIGDAVTSQDNPLRWVQQNAFNKLAKKDPAAAQAWLDQQVALGKLVSKALDPSDNPRLQLESVLLGKLSETDLAGVKSRLASFGPEERMRILSDNHHWRANGKMPSSFLEVARESLDEEKATQIIANAWSNHHGGNLADVSKSLSEVPFSDAERDAIVKQAVSNSLQDYHEKADPKATYEWAREQAPEDAGRLLGEHMAKAVPLTSLEEKFGETVELAESFNDPSITNEFVRTYAMKLDSPDADPLATFKDQELAAKARAIYEALPKENE